MLILNLIQRPLDFLAFVLALVISLTVHEASHAYFANRLGDSTAKDQGRLSLNPLRHFDVFGIIFFFIVGFGWGIPVPINARNFKNPKLDSLKVSLAGPASNLVLALFFTIIYHLTTYSANFSHIILVIIALNIVWMFFNLLPIPPLDGSHVLGLFLSPRNYAILQQIGWPILIILLFFSPVIQTFISWGLNLFFRIFVGASFSLF